MVAMMLCAAMSASRANAAEPLYPERVVLLFEKRQHLVVLWSLDCPPCFTELAMFERLLKEHPELPVTFIATDDDSTRYGEVDAVYRRLGDGVDTWVFAEGMAPVLRYAIDATWSGVLPRSYYVDQAGKRHGHSGVLNAAQVMSLFEETSLARVKGKRATGD